MLPNNSNVGWKNSLLVVIIDLMSNSAGGVSGAQFRKMIATGLSRNPDSMPGDVDIETVRAESSGQSGVPALTSAGWSAVESADVLIVTGAEPCTPELADEPIYPLVRRLLAERTTTARATLFSCLSAHVALHHLWGVPRRRLPVKRLGMFRHITGEGTALSTTLTADLPGSITMPHSRWHTMDTLRLLATGLEPVLATEDGDWACVAAESARYLFFQGHPEYFGDTLFREYRRDVRRYLNRNADEYPSIPVGYLSTAATEELADFAALARRRRKPETFARFPGIPREVAGDGPWSSHAATLAGNWFGMLGLSHV